ncbi:MAG: PKD domain-containing protein, partial [Gemmataceae bacterium]|nr:PKD domain-containing protein [Gemmataceae bacterium]
MFTHFSQPRRSRPTSRANRVRRPRAPGFQPRLEVLEDRTVLSTIAYQVAGGTLGVQDFSGPLGMDFNTTQDVLVTRLGVFDSGADGLARALTARLYNRDTGTQLADLAFATGDTGSLGDGSRFLPLATPLVLPAGFHGTMVAEGYGPGELNGNGGLQPITWTTDAGTSLAFVGGGRFGPTAGVFPSSVDGGPANRYAAGTFEFMPLTEIATGPAGAVAGSAYTLDLNLSQASNITQWIIDWGDGQTDTLAGNPSQASHVYAVSGTFTITATAYNTHLGALGSSHRAVVLASEPAAYWRLDETTPTAALDEVGVQNGVYHNFTAAQLGQPGALTNDASPSVRFDGLNDYVSLPDVFGFPPTGGSTDFTVSFSAWFRTTSAGVILGQTDLTGVPGGPAPQGWVPGVYVGIDGRVYASLFWHGNVPTLASPGFYNDGQWHQVVAVYASGSETLYLDGLRVASQSAPTVPYASDYRYFLGVGYTVGWPNTVGPWLFFNGNLDEVAVYHDELTAQQVAAQFTAARLSRPTVVVEDAPPVAFVQGPAAGVSGQLLTFTFSASSNSPTLQDAGFVYVVNWGDGSSQEVERTPGNGSSFPLTHTFAQGGSFMVRVTATDAAGHTSSAATWTTVITDVTDPAPQASVKGPEAGVRGQPLTFTFSASSSSQELQEAGFLYVILWGDGSSQVVERSSGNGSGVSLSHVFTQSESFTVTVTATDADGHTSAPASRTVTVRPWAIQTQPDPLHPGQTIQVLVVGGSTGADVILITPGTTGVGIKLQIKEKDFNRVLEAGFTERIDRIAVYGQAGDDQITVAEGIKLPAELYGGDGDDYLSGGSGADLLLGGSGNDVLRGHKGRNVLIGGQGHDHLFGGSAQSLLIGGRTAHDANDIALRSLLAEWASGDDYLTRIGHLLGKRAGGRNGAYRLSAGTVFDDGAEDVLRGCCGRDWFVVNSGDRVGDWWFWEVVTRF